MKQLTVTIPDNMYPFFLQLVENLSFVKVGDSSKDQEPSKKEILKGITDGLKEVKLHKQGKLKLKSAKQLLDEL